MCLALADHRPAHLTRVHQALTAPARGRPAAAGRDRGLEARPAPAHLPADRADLRPGRRRPRQGRARRAALAGAAGDLRRPARGLRPGPVQGRQHGRWRWTGPTWRSFSRPPPRGTSDCADPEASWGHRKNNLLRSQDELFYGYYLSAGIMMPEENGPAVPELARRATLSSCRHDPVRAFAPVLTAMPAAGIPLGDILDDSGYAHRDADAWASRCGPPAPSSSRTSTPTTAAPRAPTTAPSSPTETSTARARPARCSNSGRSPAPPPKNKPQTTTARPPNSPATSSAASPPTTQDGYHRVAVPRRHGQDPLPAPPRLDDPGPGPARDPPAPGTPPGLLRPADHHRPAGRARQDPRRNTTTPPAPVRCPEASGQSIH